MGLIDTIMADVRFKQQWFLSEKSWFTKNVRVFLEPGTIAVIVFRYGQWLRSLNKVLRIVLFFPYILGKILVVLGLSLIHI